MPRRRRGWTPWRSACVIFSPPVTMSGRRLRLLPPKRCAAWSPMRNGSAANKALAAELETAAKELSQARTRLADAYREKRKLELAQAHRLRAEAAARARRERIALDEIASNAARSPSLT